LFGVNEGHQCSHGSLSLDENYKLWDAHLQTTRGDQTRKEDSHDITGTEFTISDKLGAKPEPLDENGEGDEMG
jgi:hypothetical protein